jgi:hypothetical protein
MRGHVADEEWIDVLEGVAEPRLRSHVDACDTCRRTAAEMREGWALAGEADVPEPSPLYWDSFRERVSDAITEAPAPRRARFGWALLGWPLAAAASGVVALSVYTSGPHMPAAVPTAVPTLAAWSPLPPAADDEALPVLAAVASASDLSDQNCTGVSSCLIDLSEDESAGLTEALRAELSSGRS